MEMGESDANAVRNADMLAEKIADVMLSSSRAEGSPGPRDEL